jgi:hypothetical protein
VASFGQDMDNYEKGKIGEEFVNKLANDTFMSHWCFPSPKDEDGDKKEICDLLIEFKGSLFIFCVKNYEFKGFYERYFNKVIEKDARQLSGAERKLLHSERDISILHADGRRFTVLRSSIRRVFRIIVHLGDGVHFYPFNKQGYKSEFVHVFDKTSFFHLITYFDTIKDFSEYILKREETFKDLKVLILPSEEEEFDEVTGKQFFEHASRKLGTDREVLISGTEADLLATYIKNGRKFSDHLTSKEYNGMLYQIDGEWEAFIAKPEVRNKDKADQISYFVDEFVKREVLVKTTPLRAKLAEELLSFDRFDRRVISKSLYEFVGQYNHLKGFFIGRRYGNVDGVAVIFVFYTNDTDEAKVEVILHKVIETYTVHTNYQYKKTLLIAASNNMSQFKFGFQELEKPYDKEEEEMIRKDIATLKWFQNTTEVPYHEKEFPDDESKASH